MKKTILFLASVITLTLATSCSSDDDKDNTLNGTTWINHEKEKDFEFKVTMTFRKTTYDYKGFERVKNNIDEFEGSGTYTYDHPNVFMTEDGELSSGKINGNTMIVKFKDDKHDYIYEKE